MTVWNIPYPQSFPHADKDANNGANTRTKTDAVTPIFPASQELGFIRIPLRGMRISPAARKRAFPHGRLGYNAGVEFAARPPSTRTRWRSPNASHHSIPMLIALDDLDVRVEGKDAIRGELHTCPACHAQVTLKRGSVVVAHFAHQPQATCLFAKGESPRHLEMKSQIGAVLTAEDIAFEYEVMFGLDRRADIVTGDLVIECQVSPLGINEWNARTRFYNEQGYAVLWVWNQDRLLTSHHEDDEYRIPAEIRHCHQMSYGVVNTLDRDGNLKVWHLDKVSRGGDEYFVPEGGGETDWSPEYSPKSLRTLKSRPAEQRAWFKTGPSGHRIAWLCPKVWWK